MQGRAEATRRSLLEAAAQLFEERGYAGTSISDISTLSGRTSGAIYFHYAGKEKLALAVMEELFATWPALIGRHREADIPALEKLVALSFSVARAFRDDVVVRGGSRLWAERKSVDASLPSPFEGWIETVVGLLEEARQEGALGPSVVPRKAGNAVVYAFFGLHTVSDALDGREHIEERLHDLWLLLLPALQSKPRPGPLLDRAARGGSRAGAAATAR
ncbi:ScbR family autoregulator-binding transcription factor [Streptomyces niveus]|uniref:TetR/AcrR family transcriptional regulator n=1 Tax=Streptomyces niveus TaxID=193462 RepID=A0ABZ2AHL9_STRNV|nr:ScbR family autoregulator-binding transcription factor [Streptomyces niveus]WTA63932.1 ScbR family autoregulator-binding transcription factor [Streptomyces niveus]